MKKFIGVILVCLMTALVVFQGKIFDKIDSIIEASGEDKGEDDTTDNIHRQKDYKTLDAMQSENKDDLTVYKNAWIKKADDNKIEIISGKENISIALPVKKGDVQLKEDVLADITVKDDEVSLIRYKNAVVLDNTAKEVKDQGKQVVKSDNYGCIDVTEDFENIKLYDDENGGEKYIVFEGDKACAIIEYEKEPDINVGVVIKNNDYSEYIHNKIVLTSKKAMKCNGKKAKKISFEKKDGESYLNIGGTSIKLKENDTVLIECAGEIYISSLKRSKGIGYAGNMKVYVENEGFVLVNYPELEEYIKCVVSGEMPPEFETEAQKAQAVCARTFVMNLIKEGEGKYKKYDAYVDDSTSYQVYNFKKRNKKSDKAVAATEKMTLRYNDEYAKVFYYSTSCGYCASAQDVFGESYDYLTANIQNGEDYKSVSVMNVSDMSLKGMNMIFDNKSFKKFLDMRDKYPEKDCPWFSWSVTISYETIAKAIAKNGLDDVKKVKEVTVNERKKGGVVTELNVTTDDGICKVCNQYNVRKILTPVDSKIYKNDNTIVEKMTMLPSAFFYIDNKEGKCVIHGGGYGHGVGMSQYGADEMAKKGMNYKEILQYYYNGTKIEKDN